MKKFFLLIFLLASCAPTTPPSSQTRVITAYSTSAATPWLTELYACAEDANVAINVSAESPDIFFRLGEPEHLTFPAYQVGQEELLIVTHRESLVQNLTLEEAQALFAGRGDPSVWVWVYASDADMQILFDQLVMKGRIVTSSAKVAVSRQKMSGAINSETNSIGILPRHSISSDQSLREIYSAGMVPVLAITRVEATGIIHDLLACVSS